jgi:hypothetical protein
MGDTGASGVVGAFFILAIFVAVPIPAVALFATRRKPSPGLTKVPEQDAASAGRIIVRLILGVLLIPAFALACFIAYQVIKANIEVTGHR